MRSIRDFYSGRTVLLTGGTGFLGKALEEKLLRDCPDIRRLYLLVRPKRQPDGTMAGAMERLKREIFEAAIFARLRQIHGERFWSFIQDKVVPVEGDLNRDGLGIEPGTVARLRDEVDTVIHAAASVFFDERIDHAVEMNTLGPLRLVEMAKSFRRPTLFAFVSTCYVCGARTGRIPEAPLPAGRSPAELEGVPRARGLDVAREIEEISAFVKAVHAEADSPRMRERFRRDAELRADREGEGARDELVAEARERWLERRLVEEGMARARRLGWHEVYTFTKAMGEQLVAAGRGELPIALVRPSIIESSLAEPEPGWINGLKVADPLIAGYAKGRIPDFPGKRGAVLDIIPVDFVANATLAALERLEREPGLSVYHVASGARNPVRVGEVYDLIEEYYRRHPMRNRRGEPVRTREWSFPSARWFRFKYRAGVLAPLRLVHAAARALLPSDHPRVERLGRTVEAVRRLLYYTDIYSPYTCFTATFDSTNTRRMWESLSPEDRRRFNFDVESISWPTYIQEVHLCGLDRHVLRFGGSGVSTGRNRAAASRSRTSTDDLRTLADLLRISAERFGDKVALQVKREGAWERVTYRQLRERAGLMGALWRRSGLRAGDRVVLIAESMPEWAIAHFAAQSAGATVVPIDVHTPGFEIEKIVEFTRARALLASKAVYPALPKALRASPLPIWDVTGGGLPFEESGRPRPAPPRPDEVRWEALHSDDVCSVVFTSGPVVEPRGCQLTHRNFLSNLLSLSEALRSYETDRFVSVLPLHHALEFTGGLLMPLFSGATVTYAQSLKSKVILDLVEETGATCILAVPRIFEMLLERLRRGGDPEARRNGERNPELDSFVNKIRLLVSGGAPLDYSIYEGFAEIGIPLHEGYGLTETAPILTVNPLWAIRARSVGTPLPGIELRIEGANGDGEGEIVVRGPNVMKGYLDNPTETARVLRDGWLHTGDIGRVDSDGYVYITGRSKDLIVTGAGKNVWPEEVELFYRGIEGLSEIAVFGVREPGSTREVVHAAVHAAADRERLLEAIHRVSAERPTYQRIQQVHFHDAPLPRNAEGRFDRHALRDAALAEARRLKRTRKAAAARDEPAPATWWEREALALIGRVAGRGPDEPPGRREHLTQLLDSLQMVELVAAFEARFALPISEGEVAGLKTVGDVIERVRLVVKDRPEPPPHELEQPMAGDYWARALAQADAQGKVPSVKASPVMWPVQKAFGVAVELAMRSLFRLRVRGLDNLPRRSLYLVAANHSSHLDSLALLAALRTRARKVHVLGARDYFFDTPVKAAFFRHVMNVVPFDRDKNFIEGMRACRHVLNLDEPVLIFPEGTRSPGGRLQPFKVGLGILAAELGAAVVPAGIRGAHAALPKGRRLPRLTRIEVAFGEPIRAEDYRDREGVASSYDRYREIVNETRQRVERLLKEA